MMNQMLLPPNLAFDCSTATCYRVIRRGHQRPNCRPPAGTGRAILAPEATGLPTVQSADAHLRWLTSALAVYFYLEQLLARAQMGLRV